MTGPAGGLRWHLRADAAEVASALAADIARRAAAALAARGAYLIVLAGGSTPRRLYERLALLDTDWTRWHVYFGDERCLPRGDPERNDTMARGAWLDRVALPAAQIHAIPAEHGPQAAAEAYRRELRSVGAFDTTLLGLGEDGHTASLFPGDPQGTAPGAPDAIAVTRAPKPPAERVSLSAPRLRRARSVVLLATGESKREAVARLHRREPSLPAVGVIPDGGMDVWLDAAAAADIRSQLS